VVKFEQASRGKTVDACLSVTAKTRISASKIIVMTPTPGITRARGSGNLDQIRVSTPLCSAAIYFHGAHVTDFHPKAQSKPALWLSAKSHFAPEKPIRGGVPICFPWFGPKADDPTAPAHGFARVMEWQPDGTKLNADGSVSVSMSLESNEKTRQLWPADFIARHVVTFGRTLTMSLIVANTGSMPARFEAALHTYYTIGDIRQVHVTGLENGTYLDRLRPGERFRQDDQPIRFAGETDRTYLDTSATVTIHDPVLKRRIVIEKMGSKSTVVWNPWIAKAKAMPDFGDDEWGGMLCIETANAADNAITLPAGGQHAMTAQISVE
jgi:D-hexose-6-phosphate mutarotase